MPQLTARLSPKIRAQFDRYAKSAELDASELARLLIVRELRTPRVLQFQKPEYKPFTKSHGKSRERKLTAHFHSANLIAEFDKHSASHGLNRSDAARLIFEHELSEKWLLKAFAWAPEAIMT